MKPADFMRENTLGGPGLDGYAYRADVYCVACGEAITRAIASSMAPRINGIDDPTFQDSEQVPQPIFFGESDSAERCAGCEAFLYGEEEEECEP